MEHMDIMLIDDSPEVAELTRIALDSKKLAGKMTWFADAEVAADYMFTGKEFTDRKDLQPRLILLDLHLPLMSGHELLQIIKANTATAHIPVVMFSSSDDERDIAQSYQLGANGYLMKSADPRKFIGTVADAGTYWVTRNKPLR